MLRSIQIILLVILFTSSTQAKMKVDITRGNTEDITISFANLKTESEQGVGYELIKVIKADLIRSGLFKVEKDVELKLSNEANPISNLHNVNSMSLVTTGVSNAEAGKIEIKYRLWDVQTGKQLLGKSLKTDKKNFRRISHMIADSIYHRTTGEDSYFDSRIVYIAEEGGKKKIAMMDQDSFNIRLLTDGSNLVLTPRFSPESQRIVYMSYADEMPTIYMRNISDNTETLVGNFSGIKSAPRFSPDGKSVLMARSVNGATDIYDVKLINQEKKRLTHKSAINTSPSYSPDQASIVFNSDRSGSPQLYIMNAQGRKQHRITFEKGRYSAPSWSPRGDWISFSKVVDGEFYIGVIRPDGLGERLLAKGYLVESPTWSPNGRSIIFTKQSKLQDGKTQSRLYSVDLTGENERMIHTTTDASDPAWSPLLT